MEAAHFAAGQLKIRGRMPANDQFAPVEFQFLGSGNRNQPQKRAGFQAIQGANRA